MLGEDGWACCGGKHEVSQVFGHEFDEERSIEAGFSYKGEFHTRGPDAIGLCFKMQWECSERATVCMVHVQRVGAASWRLTDSGLYTNDELWEEHQQRRAAREERRR